MHIGVGLERHYDVGYQRHPQVLLVCDSGNSTLRMIEAMLLRKYPQLQVTARLSQREYEARSRIDEDFVISTIRLSEKEKPVVVMSPFPTGFSWNRLASWCWWTVPGPICWRNFLMLSTFISSTGR